MTQIKYKWFCKQCRYMYYGANSPDECPGCRQYSSFSNTED